MFSVESWTDLTFWAIILWGLVKMCSLSCKEIFLSFSKRSHELLLLMRTRKREKGSGRAGICSSCIWIRFHYLFYITRKSSFEKGEMERAVENGRSMISFQGKWRRKTKVLPTEKKVFFVLCHFHCHPTHYGGVPKGNRSNQKVEKYFHTFSKDVVSQSYLHSLFILSVVGLEGLLVLLLSVCMGELWHPFCSPPSSLRSLLEMHIDFLFGKMQHHYSNPTLSLTCQSPSSFAGFVCINERIATKRIWIGTSEDFNPLFIHRAKIMQQQCDWDDSCAG